MGIVRTPSAGRRHPPQRHQIVQHRLGRVYRDGKTDARALADIGSDQGVDADHFAVPVEQRAAGITGIDGRVGLDSVINLHAVGFLHRPDRTDDAIGHGAGQTEGIADGIDLLPHLQIARVAEHHRESGRGL